MGLIPSPSLPPPRPTAPPLGHHPTGEVAPHRQHLLYDVWLADPALLTHVAPWRDLLRAAALQSGATILAENFHQFEPHGVTGILLLAESHISVHTWPEEGFAALDIFTCGRMDPHCVIASIRQALVPHREQLIAVGRGILHSSALTPHE